MTLSPAQRRHLLELYAVALTNGHREAYWRPTGGEFASARSLARLGYVQSSYGLRQYALTDAGFKAAAQLVAA